MKKVGLWLVLFGVLTLAGCGTTQKRVLSNGGVRPKEIIRCEAYKTDWPKGDCAYHAVTPAKSGKVYFSIGCHKAQQSAHVFEFDPALGTVRTLWSVDQTVPLDGSISQGKIHSFLREMDGEIYLLTHDAWGYKDHKDPVTGKIQTPFPGGYVCAVDVKSGKGRVIAQPFANRPTVGCVGKEVVPMDGDSLITGVFDAERGMFYVLTWPGALFGSVNVRTGEVVDYGPMQGKASTVPDKIKDASGKEVSNPEHEVVLRTLGLDGDGNVYGSRRNGEIWKYDAAAKKIVVMKSRMEQATAKKGEDPRKGPLNYWRVVVWDDQEKVFYGIHWGTSWLFRFDPKADKMEPVIPWRPNPALGDSFQGGTQGAQLGLTMGPRHTLYGFVHTDPWKPELKRSVHLVTYNLDQKQFKDHGIVETEKGMALMFCESCAVAPNGDVYAVGWLEADANNQDEDGPTELAGFTYHMGLVRIPAKNLSVLEKGK